MKRTSAGAALDRLIAAVARRENTTGDPITLISAQAELRAAMEQARAALQAAPHGEAQAGETPRTLIRPIIGIENRTAQEVFTIMVDRITRAQLAAQQGDGWQPFATVPKDGTEFLAFNGIKETVHIARFSDVYMAVVPSGPYELWHRMPPKPEFALRAKETAPHGEARPAVDAQHISRADIAEPEAASGKGCDA